MHVPVSIALRPDGVHIEWEDGEYSRLEYRELRGSCPCATCIHEMTGKRIVGPDEVPHNVEALDYMLVGQYATQFLWSDAHDTGIYPYNLLRRLAGLVES